ncbi:glycosyltransferase family 2 protein [Candidatus Neptunochlamydia vexilliferae]|uniref:Glycosyltransferase 2-like domain-containing protein n=1 Tax=Candidatus Neptunichlamydia vexilliferae TaxID=1651774 RepID=A0ABS0B140_9BACT|nr:glycosyltransferase family 2 protein [Candidatus Neptunochlamydia vexilliferae]MBF5059904.1 hypothetical protein [Candidatus Neptunochlamydia vexilliferae]
MTLSVIMPNYNHAKYLSESLGAITSQSCCATEILFIDDASTDNSIEVIKHFPQITLLQNPKNLGPIETMNRGIQESNSEYIAFCSADDIILPGFFEKAITFLNNHPEIGLCSGKTCHFKNTASDQLIPQRMPLGNKPRSFDAQTLPKIFKKTTYFIHTTCAIFRRKHLLEFGGLNPKLLSLSDWYLNCQIALKYGAAYLPHYFAAFRLHDESYSKKLKASPKQEEMFHALMEEIKETGPEWEKLVKKTGLLAHAGVRMVLFLAKHPEYRSYFPRAFLKKCQFHWSFLRKGKM